LGISPIQETYTRFGEVVIPNFDSTVSLMTKVANNLESEFDKFYNQIPEVVEKYNWQNLTNSAINSLVDRIGIDMFNSGSGK